MTILTASALLIVALFMGAVALALASPDKSFKK
jgi:hypothetical protein